MIILKILSAELVREDMWMVWIKADDKDKFPQARLIPVGEPKVCPGGPWCKDFNCEENLKKFKEAELVNIGESEGFSVRIDMETDEDGYRYCKDDCPFCELDPDHYEEDWLE